MTVTLDGGPPQIEVHAIYSSDWHPITGVYQPGEYRYSQSWFSGSFLERWKYTIQVRYHPILRDVIHASVVHRIPVWPSEMLWQQILPPNRRMGIDQGGEYRHSHAWLRRLLLWWKYRIVVCCHPVLRETVKTYAARVVPVRPSEDTLRQ